MHTPETDALNAQIAEQQKLINEALRELGDAYARKYGPSFDPAFTPQFNKIFAAQNAIGNMLSEIRELKGLTLCQNCRNEYPKNAPACTVCGCPNPSYIPPAPPQPAMPVAPTMPVAQSVACTACGFPVKEGNLFCTNCGKKIEEVAAPAPAPQGKVCRSCGAVMPDENAFCSNCGTRF